MELMRRVVNNAFSKAKRLTDGVNDAMKWMTLLVSIALLPACSGDSFTSGDGTAGGGAQSQDCLTDPTLPECQVTASSVSLRVSKREVKSDNSDSAEIIATVLDENNAAMNNVQVEFTAARGKLDASIVSTDEKGEATVNFSSGSDNPYNGTVYIAATVVGVGSATTPVDIIGSTVTIETVSTSVSGSTVTHVLKITAADASGQSKDNIALTFALSAPDDTSLGTATATLSAAAATSDSNGEASVTMTSTSAGKIKFTVTGLGASDSEEYTISTFRITSPTSSTADPYTVSAETVDTDGLPNTVTVSVASSGITTVRFVTTVGHWQANGLTYLDVATGGAATTSAVLEANDGEYGIGTVFAFSYNASDPNTDIYDTIPVAMTPPVSAAAEVITQSDVKTLALSTGTTTYSTTVSAKVVTNTATFHYPIKNAPVLFTITRSVGGGEYLTKSFGFTGLDGVATTKLVSGNQPTGQEGVRVTATVAGTAFTDTASVEFGGVAGSVALGTPRLITENEDNLSINTYNMSAVVADGTGAAVPGAQVTLHFWPAAYLTGVWYDNDPDLDAEEWRIYYSGSFVNEDSNENLILDTNEDVNQDNELTPGNSTAGAGPSLVTTGSDGAAPFDFIYLKDYAGWVNVRARGTTRVLGTEATTTTYFIPANLKSEVDAGLVHDSPFQLILQGDSGGTANYPGTAIPWSIPALKGSGTEGFTAARGTFSGTNYQIDAAEPSGTYTDVITISNSTFGVSAQFFVTIIVN